MIDELQAAELFLQVVRAQGFSSAAKTLGKSPSTLSRAVADLEQHLGAQLLTRTTRQLHLTEAGVVFVQHAEQLLAARRAAIDAIAELTGGVPRGRLRVSMPVAVGERLLANSLPEFRRRYPELRLEVDLSDRNVALVEGGFDVAIRVGQPSDSSLRAQLLGKVPVVLVASPAWLSQQQEGGPKSPADVSRCDCVVVGPVAGPAVWTLYKGDRKESVSVAGVVHTTSPTFGAQLACHGFGLLRTTEWVIREELRRGELVPVMTSWSLNHPQHGGVPVYVMYAQAGGVAPPLKSRVFVEMVKAVMATVEAGGAAPDPSCTARSPSRLDGK
jgi:DNA-binding transcriptional LysR family regulator